MKTRLVPANDPDCLEAALEILLSGGLVALPTDTVYGLGAQAFNAEAVLEIYRVKQRPPEKAIPILLADPVDLEQVATQVPEMAMRLAKAFWPGALTLIVPRHPLLPEVVSATAGVGVRIPAHPFTRELIRRAGALAVTSANLSGQADAADAQEVLAQLNGCVPLVIDAGRVGQGLASSVVDCMGAEPRMLREGAVTLEQVRMVLGV